MTLRRAFAILLLATVAGCSAGRRVDSGIEGVALVGPTCPVEQPGVPGCEDRPLKIEIRVVEQATGEHVATMISSGNDGRFRIAIPPGDYTLLPPATGGPSFAEPIDVTVRPHRFEQVTITFDSGIR